MPGGQKLPSQVENGVMVDQTPDLRDDIQSKQRREEIPEIALFFFFFIPVNCGAIFHPHIFFDEVSVKNLIAAAWVSQEAWVLSPAAPWVKRSHIATAMAQVTAVAWIQSLAWELPYAMGMTIKK